MKTKVKVLAIIISAIVIATIGFTVEFRPIPTQTPATSLIKTTPTPITSNVTVSGLIISHGLTVPPTEVQFINTETHEVYKAPISQPQYSYAISLPVNQTYGIEGDWNGRTFNATGIPMGAITMRCDNGLPILNLDNAKITMTQNLVVGQ